MTKKEALIRLDEIIEMFYEDIMDCEPLRCPIATLTKKEIVSGSDAAAALNIDDPEWCKGYVAGFDTATSRFLFNPLPLNPLPPNSFKDGYKEGGIDRKRWMELLGYEG